MQDIVIPNVLRVERYIVDCRGNATKSFTGMIPEREMTFITRIGTLMSKFFKVYFPSGNIDATQISQSRFVSMMEEILVTCALPDGSLDVFSAIPDHRGRDMRRFRYVDKETKYVVDVFANLDVSLKMSKMKRFVLTHVPQKWVSYDTKNIVSTILYRTRIWISPNAYYLITHFECDLNIPYSSYVERARELVGLPATCDLKERKAYERFDYDTRRALLDKVYNVQQEGFGRRRPEARH